jgi:pyruvate dehydrogenase E2 component (dihydrolipoamide acetyltransferase)
MVEFRMPSLGADMEAGTLVEWLVKPGDRVNRGDVVAVVETQKGAIEIEIFDSGKVERILVELDSKVPVGTPLARILTDEEAKSGGAAVAVSPTIVPAAVVPEIVRPAAPVTSGPAIVTGPSEGRMRASPAARRLARARGVDLAATTGSGPGGAIIRVDVERGLAGVTARTEKGRSVGLDLGAMRAAIAAAMARSKREIPHYYLEHHIEVGKCEAWLARTNAERPPDRRLLMGALALKAVALAARRFPAVNGFYREGQYEPSDAIHAGVAIAIRGGGLAAPAIRDADKLALDDLMARMRDLVQRMRAGRIRSSEIADATITVSSLGERGVEALYGVIYPPQVALVGFGKVTLRPWVIDGAIGPRPVITVTLAADHRVSDGHAGALFLAEIGKLLQEPEKL